MSVYMRVDVLNRKTRSIFLTVCMVLALHRTIDTNARVDCARRLAFALFNMDYRMVNLYSIIYIKTMNKTPIVLMVRARDQRHRMHAVCFTCNIKNIRFQAG